MVWFCVPSTRKPNGTIQVTRDTTLNNAIFIMEPILCETFSEKKIPTFSKRVYSLSFTQSTRVPWWQYTESKPARAVIRPPRAVTRPIAVQYAKTLCNAC